jgi:hypothetical protein
MGATHDDLCSHCTRGVERLAVVQSGVYQVEHDGFELLEASVVYLLVLGLRLSHRGANLLSR